MQMIINILHETRVVAGQMSPYLLFGFLAAGVLHVLVSPAWMRRHLGGRGIMPVVKSVLLGVPLPLCSCGVIAVTASIRKQGAGRGAATGFLLATPQTGVDSIVATWGMLGPVLGIFRPLIALMTGIVGGGLAAFFDPDKEPARNIETACCAYNEERPERSVAEVLRYGMVTLPRDIAKPLLIGVIIAGAIAALAPKDLLAPYIGGGILAMVVMTVVGVPLYVCATASIPVALSFIHLGASPGAALVFLVAGPATNAATIATVWKVLGPRTMFIYLGTVVVGGIASGLIFDAISGRDWALAMHQAHATHNHEGGATAWNLFFAVLLAVVVLNSVYGDRIRGLFRAESAKESTEVPGDARFDLSVSGMTCSHCANAVTQALRNVTGARDVNVELSRGKATVTGEAVNPDQLLQAVRELGYKAELAE